jgi:very-short-patch-repair endonuclease
MNFYYYPPYDSPIEDIFAWNLSKYINSDIKVFTQFAVNTIGGKFILDFLLELPNKQKILVECDGKEFHDIHRDEWRDGMILGDNYATFIYRIRGSDLYYHINDVLFIISRIHPELISERGHKNLSMLASEEVKKLPISINREKYIVDYESESKKSNLHLMTRQQTIPNGERRYWKTVYDFVVSVGGGNIDELMKQKYELNIKEY